MVLHLTKVGDSEGLVHICSVGSFIGLVMNLYT